MPMSNDHSQTPFEWLPEYDGLLEQIASTDVVDAEWTNLREIIKYKLDKNIGIFLSAEGPRPPPLPTSPRPLPSGGLKLPPFLPRPNPSLGNGKKCTDAPKIQYSTQEANEFKESIYAQLNEFDGAPFTIQRVAELCLHPTRHYKYLGKYLRAVEKSLLVTSTWDSFPIPSPGHETNHGGLVASDSLGNMNLTSAPSTPMFSPIPFLHDDARRSKSGSPPPSPLMLAVENPTLAPIPRTDAIDAKAIGLVDELDDPSPGHLSAHPHALSATTTVVDPPSLTERFVKASEEQTMPQPMTETPAETSTTKEADDMVVDDPEKENKAG